MGMSEFWGKGYGSLFPEMEALLAKHVRGRTVWDLGAGDLSRSRQLIGLGAQSVVAVDKETMPEPGTQAILRMRTYFAQIPTQGAIDVAFLGWPQNSQLLGLLELLDTCRKVVYLGSNTNGNACGNARLFEHLLTREVLEHVPHRLNTFIVYGERGTTPRKMLPEEWAALQDRIWTLEEAQRATSSGC